MAHAIGLPVSDAEPSFKKLKDGEDGITALYAKGGQLDLGGSVVLEEYTLTHAGELPEGLATAMAGLHDEPLWKQELASRLVVVSDGMMSFFTRTATEVAQHVCIDDTAGTAKKGALFNQENVPSETLFFAMLHALPGFSAQADDAKETAASRTAGEAMPQFESKLKAEGGVLQIGGDASTGLGYCSVCAKTVQDL